MHHKGLILIIDFKEVRSFCVLSISLWIQDIKKLYICKILYKNNCNLSPVTRNVSRFYRESSKLTAKQPEQRNLLTAKPLDTISGGGPVHARVPIHAHPQFS